MKYVVVINGRPASGKTTLNTMIAELVSKEWNKIDTTIISTIDYIKQIYKKLGWDGVSKTNEDRRNLSYLKGVYISKCDGPLMDIVSIVAHSDDNKINHVFLVDCRESKEIEKIALAMRILAVCQDIVFVTVYVKRGEVIKGEKEFDKYGNSSDDISLDQYNYDYVVMNNGSLSELEEAANELVCMIINAKPKGIGEIINGKK